MTPTISAKGVPPLEAGDLLSRAEFERRYQAMPHVKKAELLEGVVHMASPVRWEEHASPHADLITWLGTYRAFTPCASVGDNATVRLDMESNEPQPDAAMIIRPDRGGMVRIEDGYVVGAPELVAEIAASSVSIDVHKKLKIYRRNQVQEYVIWRVMDQAVDWYVWREGQYELQAADERGLLKGSQFPGLWLDVPALVRGDLIQVLKTLQEGLASPEHREFLAK